MEPLCLGTRLTESSISLCLMKKIVEPFEEIKYIGETFSEDRPVLHQSIRTYMNACLRGPIVILFGAHVHLAMINAFFGYNRPPV